MATPEVPSTPAPPAPAYMTREQVDAAIQEAIAIYHERVLERLLGPLRDAVDAHTRQLNARPSLPPQQAR